MGGSYPLGEAVDSCLINLLFFSLLVQLGLIRFFTSHQASKLLVGQLALFTEALPYLVASCLSKQSVLL